MTSKFPLYKQLLLHQIINILYVSDRYYNYPGQKDRDIKIYLIYGYYKICKYYVIITYVYNSLNMDD